MTEARRFLTLSDRPLILGHRGASAQFPENTLLAFREAMRQGADGVELDVMLCKSGEVVVVHDDDLSRVAGANVAVRTTPLSELRRYDLGQGQRIPTLEEALEELGPFALVNVELKSQDVRGALDHLRLIENDGLAAATAEVLRRQGRCTLDRAFYTLVSSFDPFQLLRFRKSAGGALPLGYLFHRDQAKPLRKGWLLPLLQPAAVHPDSALVKAESLQEWHRAGYAVHTWTVDDPKEIKALRKIGVDGIISNQPGVARSVLEQPA